MKYNEGGRLGVFAWMFVACGLPGGRADARRLSDTAYGIVVVEAAHLQVLDMGTSGVADQWSSRRGGN